MRSGRRLSKSEAVIFISLLAGVLAIADVLLKVPQPWRTVILGVVGVAFLWLFYELWPRRRFPIERSGIEEFRETFDIEGTGAVLEEAEEVFCYKGVSFSSVWSIFKTWYGKPGRKNVRHIRLLLADPTDDASMQAAAAWEGKEKNLEEAAALVRERIQLTVREIESMGHANIEVRFHREPCHEWMYIVDRKIYLGLVKRGSHRHHNPVAVFAPEGRSADAWNLYDHYMQEWETLWNSARVHEHKK